jgi:hypothetical protein
MFFYTKNKKKIIKQINQDLCLGYFKGSLNIVFNKKLKKIKKIN